MSTFSFITQAAGQSRGAAQAHRLRRWLQLARSRERLLDEATKSPTRAATTKANLLYHKGLIVRGPRDSRCVRSPMRLAHHCHRVIVALSEACSVAAPRRHPLPHLWFVRLHLTSQAICMVPDGIHAHFNDPQAFFLLWRVGDKRPE